MDYRNLKKHLNILYETLVCGELRPYFKNKQKELTKNPKIFFQDMGFRNNLIESFQTPAKRPDAGAVIENTCCVQLHMRFNSFSKMNFWRTKAGAKVDFVLHVGGRSIPLEVKYSLSGKETLTKSLVSFIDTYKPNRALVLTKNYWGRVQRGATEVLFAPVYYL